MLTFPKRLGYSKRIADMYGKPFAKKFYYSSEGNAKAIEGYLNDLASVSEISVSNLIENTLIDAHLPEDPLARHWVTRLYTHESLYSVKRSLEDIFSYEKNELYGEEIKPMDCYPFVELTVDLLVGAEAKNALDETGDHYLTQAHRAALEWKYTCEMVAFDIRHLKASLDRIESGQTNDEPSSQNEIMKMREIRELEIFYEKMLDHLEKLATYKPSSLIAAALFLRDNWSVLGANGSTFDFLHSLLSASEDWQEHAADRFAFAEACKLVMPIWTARRVRQSKRQAEYVSEISYATISISDGDIIQIPVTWLVANPHEAPKATHAFVMEILRGEDYDSPHILYLSEKSYEEIGAEDREEILRACEAIWPRLKEVREADIEPKYGPHGKILNKDEYMSSPKVGLFNIMEKSNPDSKTPYNAGIIRKRREASIE